MRLKNYSLFCALLLSVLFSCTNSSKESNQENSITETAAEESYTEELAPASVEKTSDAETNEPDTDTKKLETKLSGVYTTSTKMPHRTYSYEKLFDNDQNTFWQSMKGAGPDEGIMLYFDQPTLVTHLAIQQKKGDPFASITSIELFIDGRPEGNFSLDKNLIAIGNKKAKSLFIKFSGVTDTKNVQGSKENYNLNINFDTEKSLAISEIELRQNDQTLDLIVPQIIEGNLQASSTLSPVEAYGIQNLMDAHKEFAWVEGAAGKGVGESITAKLENETEITGFVINNGFQRSEKHFKANGRVKQLTISDENGHQNTVTIKDEMGPQNFQLPHSLKGKTINIKIDKVYDGSAYEDLVISELKFIQANNFIIISDNQQEKQKDALIKKAKNTTLENILDRRIYYWEGEYDAFKSSIILRSDYTFVSYYEELEDGEVFKETVADGNWEIKELNDTKSIIRVFGKLTNVSTTIDYYAGNSTDSFIQIFQDFVTIDNKSIAGEKFINKHLMISEK